MAVTAVVVGIDTYISIADCTTYFDDRNDATFSGKTDDEKNASLRIATNYIDANFKGKFKGYIVSEDQLLSWPRSGAVDAEGRDIASDEYPPQLKEAVCQLALKSFDGELQPDIEAGGQVKRRKVASLEVEYNGFASPEKQYSFVENLLKDILEDTGNTIGRG